MARWSEPNEKHTTTHTHTLCRGPARPERETESRGEGRLETAPRAERAEPLRSVSLAC